MRHINERYIIQTSKNKCLKGIPELNHSDFKCEPCKLAKSRGNLKGNPSRQKPSGKELSSRQHPTLDGGTGAPGATTLIECRSNPSGGTIGPSQKRTPGLTHVGPGATSTKTTTTKDPKPLTTSRK
ncbi:hypothetical protein AVEN_249588-1 [Araneus ventricosus]|uniref:Uncharacterized protein n=1 Tax=Araneus ventricosus TaxID=182803 RepID=A0A4Y2MFU7_ARAVE|nr:hypothetical protein AVEN_249588-1 [Araneus ventricosus]